MESAHLSFSSHLHMLGLVQGQGQALAAQIPLPQA